MRPVKLIMSAFGPYAKEEVVDFQLLNGKNIFLITGPTGAGKTTIFDAISYALFGEASGSTRENDSLRSDFAEAKRLTYVELDFELRGEGYHIRRVPQQLKPKVKGTGFTIQGAEAELVLPDNSVRTGSVNVSNKIGELLGINKEQFKQIVMLPQGEFKRLLLADSREREGIFRKIFSTYTYEKIQNNLYEKSRNLYKDIEKNKERVLANLNNIKSDITIECGDYIDFSKIKFTLEEIINNDKNKNKDVEDRLKSLSQDIEKLQEEKIKGKNNNGLLDEKEDLKKKLEDMMLQDSDIKLKEEKLTNANKAKDIIYIEEDLISKKRNRDLKLKDKSDVVANIEIIKKKIKLAEENLKIQQEKEPEREELFKEISLLKEKEPKLKEIEDKKLNIRSLKSKIENNSSEIKKENKEIELLKSELKNKEEEIKKINEIEKDRILLLKDVEEKEYDINKTREVYKGIVRLEDEKIKHKELTDKFIKIEELYKKYKDEYEVKEEIYMKEQAGILASKLKADDPCPVCGSLSHPRPAKRVNNIPTEGEVKDSKDKYESKREEYNNLILLITNTKNSMDGLIIDVINPKLKELAIKIKCNAEYYKDSLIEIKNAGVTLGEEIKLSKSKMEEMSNQISNKEKLENRLIEIDGAIKEKEEKLKKLSESYTNMFGELRGDEEILKKLEEDVPVELRSLEELKKKIIISQEKLSEYNRLLKEAIEKDNMMKNSLSSEEAKNIQLDNILKELDNEIEIVQGKISDKFKEYGFNHYEQYKEAKELLRNIGELDREITKYKEELKSVSDRQLIIEEKTKNLAYIDLEILDEEIRIKKLKEVEETKIAKDIYSILTNNINILNEIKGMEKLFINKEEEYRVIGELSNLANGKKSPYITFERFVLASYFQEIIDSANIRLAKMTNERFILIRKEDKGKGTSQQGLELEVYDNYTGKSRHVKTLSGGESFKASLSLALGLSDVVQANAGGVSLDTMFIDEGFGTLDPESLENAINSLLELQRGGRLVGIISHVPELKERIESQLEIKSSSEGSSARFNTY